MYITDDGFQITEQDFLQFANVNGYNLINRISEEQQRLRQLYSTSGMTEEAFYKSIMLDYSKKIALLILQDYGTVLDNETKSKIESFCINDESVVFVDRKDFPEVSVNGDKPNAYARKSEGKVYFPPYDKTNDIITFIRQREQDLVHEMFHIVTSNTSEKQDLLQNGIKVGQYKPGSLFDEALVEKSARDFATKHNLIYQPMAQYIPYVNSLEMFMRKYNIQHNHQMFNRNYSQIIGIATPQEQQQYHAFENNYNLRRLNKNTMSSENHVLEQDTNNLDQHNQLIKPKTKVKTMNNGIAVNNNGFTSIMSLITIGLIVVLGIVLGYLLI